MRRRGIEIPPQREQTEADVLRSRLFKISVEGESTPNEAREIVQQYVQKQRTELGALRSEIQARGETSAASAQQFEERFQSISKTLDQIESTPLTLSSIRDLHEYIATAHQESQDIRAQYGASPETPAAPEVVQSVEEPAPVEPVASPEQVSEVVPEVSEVTPERADPVANSEQAPEEHADETEPESPLSSEVPETPAQESTEEGVAEDVSEGAPEEKKVYGRNENIEDAEFEDEPPSPVREVAPYISPDMTSAELRQNMRRNLEEMERMAAQNESTDQARDAYFAALKTYQESRSGMSLAGESLVGERLPEELKEMRRAWIQERAEFARTQQDAAEARLSVRPRTREEVLDGLQRHRGKESLDKEAVLARYRRMVTERSVVLGAEEQENQVRINALSGREKDITDRLMERYRQLPAGVRIMGTSALLVGGGALLTGTGVGLAALALGGTSAALRVFAEKQKDTNPKVSKFLGAISRLTSVAGVAGLISETAVRGAHDILGTEKKAADSLASRDHGDLTDWENLEKVSVERKSAIGARENIERQSRWARIVGSLTGGAVLGSVVSGGSEAADTPPAQSGSSGGESGATSAAESQQPPVTDSAPAAESGGGVVSGQPPAASEGTAESTIAQTTAPSAESVQMAVGATIHEPGQGTDQLFAELKQNVAERGLFTGSESPALKFLTESSPNDISRAMDDFGTRGIVTQIGDRFFVGEDQNVYFQSANGDPQMFIENTPGTEGGITIHKLDTQALGEAAPAAPVAAPEVTAPPVPEVSEPIPTPESIPTTPSELPLERPAQPSAEPAPSESPEPAPVVESTPPSFGTPLPIAEQAPVESPVEEPAPSEPESSEPEAPVEQAPAQPSAAAELITSKFGVEVNPSEPGVYTYLDAKGKEVTAIFGGTSPDRFLAAQEYLERNPGTTIRLQLEEKDLVTGAILRTPVVEWSSAENGMIQMSPSGDFEGKNALQAPDPQQFTKKVSFIFSR